MWEIQIYKGMKQHNNLELIHVVISGTALSELQKTEDATDYSPGVHVEQHVLGRMQ